MYLRLPQGIVTSSVVPAPCSKLITLRTPVPAPAIIPPTSFLTNGSVPPQELPLFVATAPSAIAMNPLLVTWPLRLPLRSKEIVPVLVITPPTCAVPPVLGPTVIVPALVKGLEPL